MAQRPAPRRFATALELLEREERQRPISTSSTAVDDLLRGGIPLGKLTEVAGVAGLGKTQLCLQLCVNVQVPSRLAGNEGQAIFIDTEGSFSTIRLEQIAAAAVADLGFPADFSAQTVLNGVYYVRCRDQIELTSAVYRLHSLSNRRDQPINVKLVVVDGVASLFRHDMEDSGRRNLQLNSILSELMKFALSNDSAILLTNQMTTRFDASGRGHVTAALGDSWGHNATNRIVLSWNEAKKREFRLVKSSFCREGRAVYRVTSDGIRDDERAL